VQVTRVSDAGRYRVVDTRAGDHVIKLLAAEGVEVPADRACLAFDPAHTQVYADGWVAGKGGA
jgi:glycerol transport system ATP-binding protein